MDIIMKHVKLFENFINESKTQFQNLQIGDKFLRFGLNGQLWKKTGKSTAVFIRNVGKRTAPFGKKAGFVDFFTQTMDVTLFENFLFESNQKPGPDPYMKGLDNEDEEEKKDQMKKQAKMDDDDPDAYKEMPGDKEAREEGKVKTSKYVKKYHELYGDKKKNESNVTENDNLEMLKLMNKAMKMMPGSQKQKEVIKQLNVFRKANSLKPLKESAFDPNLINESAKGDRGPIDDSSIESGLKKKSEETGVPIGLLRIVMRRGMAAWKSGHRPGATQQQWGYARVNSFLTKQEGTWGGADADVAKEVRDGGHDKNLKKG